MDARRLDELLAAYGADPRRWPEAERAEGEALLARSPAQRAHAAAAARLDALLDTVPAGPEASLPLRARVLASAPVRPRSRWRRSRLLAAALPLAAGLLLWMTWGPGAPGPQTVAPGDVQTAGRQAPIDVAALDLYDLPSDDLLSLSDDDAEVAALDLYDDVPAIGCSDGTGLGCPDLDVLPGAQSRTPPAPRRHIA